MLKIRDYVNLKELEKYGFYLGTTYITDKECYFSTKIMILVEDRIIKKEEKTFDTTDYDTLYDLIKADLVEKVD
jgi:hypothetical protein